MCYECIVVCSCKNLCFCSYYKKVHVNFCCESEILHEELRARTACELAVHSDFYLSDDKLPITDPDGGTPIRKHTGKNVLVFCSQNYEKAIVKSSQGNSTSPVEITFQIDCMQTANLGEWCGMWYIYGLYSVLGLKLQSIYPEFNKTIRPVYNKIVKPRVSKDVSCNRHLAVMWTRIGGKLPIEADSWAPNHFVPCLHNSYFSSVQMAFHVAPQGKTYAAVTKLPLTHHLPSCSFPYILSSTSHGRQKQLVLQQKPLECQNHSGVRISSLHCSRHMVAKNRVHHNQQFGFTPSLLPTPSVCTHQESNAQYSKNNNKPDTDMHTFPGLSKGNSAPTSQRPDQAPKKAQKTNQAGTSHKPMLQQDGQE